MIPVLLLHLLVIICSIFFAQAGVSSQKKREQFSFINIGIVVSFFILLCFLGFRDNLGRDWDNYIRIIGNDINDEFEFGETRELGYLVLVEILRYFDLDFHYFIFITSFLTLLPFFFSYRKFPYLLPFGLFVFFMDWGYPVSINTIRQSIAMMFAINAALYINSQEKYSLIKFLFFCFLGILFHYSIIIFFPFYFIGRINLRLSSLILLCISVFLLSFVIVIPLYEKFLGNLAIYEGYVSDKRVGHSSFGFGALLVMAIRFAPILVYNYVKNNHPSFIKYFIIYFIGLSIYYPLYNYLMITRMTFYMQFFELIVISYFLYYLFIERKNFKFIGLLYMSVTIFNYLINFEAFLSDQLVSNHFSLMFIDFYFNNNI